MTVFDDSRRVLGIDLACRSWDDIGSALVAFKNECFSAAVPGVMAWPSEDLTPAAVAGRIDVFARDRDVAAVSIDGPQAWRDPTTPAQRPGVGRACEYETRTPGKTGTCGMAYPSTFLRWIRFSISVFAELLSRRDVVLVNDEASDIAPRPAGYWLMECFPTSTWRTSGLEALPGHRRAPAEVVERFARRLVAAYGLPPSAVTADHDDLQAVVSTLPAVGLLGGPGARIRSRRAGTVRGCRACRRDHLGRGTGRWSEGGRNGSTRCEHTSGRRTGTWNSSRASIGAPSCFGSSYAEQIEVRRQASVTRVSSNACTVPRSKRSGDGLGPSPTFRTCCIWRRRLPVLLVGSRSGGGLS